jgi:hypothetical protein
MTAPIRPTPKSLDGRSARELIGIERTVDNDDEVPGSGSSGTVQPVVVAVPIKNGDDVDVFYAQPSGELDPGWPVVRYDSRGNNQIRIVPTVETAGHSTAEVFAQYSQDGSSWATPGASSADVEASIANTGPKPAEDAGWVTLTAAAIADRLWRARLRGGNATASPAIHQCHLQFRQRTQPPPPRGTPGDLPEGDWGNIIHDLNAVRLLNDGTYADGAEVSLWPDDSVSGIDGVASIGSPTGPTYQATAWTGGKPCVRWPGGNTNPIHFSPTPTQDSYTVYFVGTAITAGYAFTLYNGFDGYPFGKLLQATGGVLGVGLGASVNDNVFAGTYTAISDTWDMTTPHIYRFVFNRLSGRFWVFVDGTMVGSTACNPQITQTTNTLIGQFNTLAGTLDLARCVTYDTPHVTPDHSSLTVSANGLTVPELVLQAYWETP